MIKEDINCYETKKQRSILVDLFKNEIIKRNFFLTGGTALSVFYLHHRKSQDLDLFSVEKIQLSDIYDWIKKYYAGENVRGEVHESFARIMIAQIKVELAHDPLSIPDDKIEYIDSENHLIRIDSLRNIASNKLCALVSRTEARDFYDFYKIMHIGENLDIQAILSDAVKKEALFDDPPTVAYQIEEKLENMHILLREALDLRDKDETGKVVSYFKSLSNDVYHKL